MRDVRGPDSGLTPRRRWLRFRVDAQAAPEVRESALSHGRESASSSDHQPSAGGDHGWSSVVDGVDDLGRVDAVEIEQPRALAYQVRPRFRITILVVEIHPSARKHGIADEDIEHAMRHPLAIDDQDDDTRLYLGRPGSPICSRS
jgi:hypothetical protein